MGFISLHSSRPGDRPSPERGQRTPGAAEIPVNRQPRRHWLHWLLALVAVGASALASAEAESGFSVESADTRFDESVYLLDADLRYRFNPRVLEALENGVPITIAIDIEVERHRRWWLNETVATLEQRYQLDYHALADQYVVRNLNSGAVYSFHGLAAALHALGTVRDLPLLDSQFVEPGEEYQVILRARLDIEELPSPLRPLAYVTPAWRLRSDWYLCSLTP